MTTPTQKTARTAGLLYLLLAITGGFGIMYIPTVIMVPTDAAATANNIITHEWLYRLSIAANIISQVTFVFLALALYRLFENVNKNQARIMVGLVIASVPITFVNMLNEIMPLVFLNNSEHMKAFDQNQLQGFVMAFLDLSNHGTAVVEVFWGLWLFPFGLLIIRSGFIPRIFGILLIIACFGYLTDTITHLLFPAYNYITAPITAATGTIGEFAIILWLLIKGAKV